MSGGPFPTPLLRPAADPAPPPEFHLPPTALRLPALSSPLKPRLPGSDRGSSSLFTAARSAPAAASERQPERSEELRQRQHDAQVEGDAWRMNTPAPFLFPAAVASEAAASEAAAGRMAGVITRGRGRTPVTRARSCSWACSNRNSTPERSLPMRAASSILLSGAYSPRFAHPFRGTHPLPVVSHRSSISSNSNSVGSGGDLFELRTHYSSSHPGGVAAATEEVAATAVTPAAGRLDTSQLTAEGDAPTTPQLEACMEGKGRGDVKTADDSQRAAALMGTKSALLPLSYEAAKLLGDAQSPSSRGSVSSIHTCSTRSSASGPSAPDELERTLLSMVQPQHMRQQQCLLLQRSAHMLQQQQQQQAQGVLGKEVGTRAADDTKLAGGPGAAGYLVGGEPADLETVNAAVGSALEMEGVAATEGSRAAGTAGGSVKCLLHGEAAVECRGRLLPHPFIGLSPAAQKGLPDEGEAAGIFERIWADVLRREAAPQQAATPMLESTRVDAAGTAGEELRLRSTAAREEEEEQQQQQRVLLSAGTERNT